MRYSRVLLVGSVLLSAACGRTSLDTLAVGAGGVTSRDGAVTTGGVRSTGGAAGSGGGTSTGARQATGGTVSAGGTTSTGGGTSSGGSAGTTSRGGTTSAGGTASYGGSTGAGGTAGYGGSTGAGGMTSTGGATSAGGTAGHGGTTSAGGTAGHGGTTSAGGTTGAGGTTSAGGTASHGGATGAGGTAGHDGAAGADGTAGADGATSTGGATSAGGTTSSGGTTSTGGTTSSGGTTSENRDAATDGPDATDTAEDSAAMDAPDGASVTPPSTLAYTALIITDDAYADAFQQLAQIHTLTGVPTQVVTVETICGASATGCDDGNPCGDTSKVIKDYLINQYGAGLQHVVLGGDGTIVPSRQTSDSYSNTDLGVNYNETFYTDYYFADLSQWDSNGDCIYGDPNNDSPDYLPELDVTRISVSYPSELQTYITKVEDYLASYARAQIDTALFLSNVATQIPIPYTSTTVPVDSALYFEAPGRTLSLMPSDFAITKLYYATSSGSGAQKLTVPLERTAFENGVNLVVHAGHGNESDLTVEYNGTNAFSGLAASELVNSQYPIMLSCACQAATFVDGDACAGQNFITAPNGGGVGYLGNSTIGLGIAGGMQLIDQFLRYAFDTSGVLVGEAVMAGHANLPTSDSFDFPLFGLVQVVDANSWRWTQKAATYLGDGLLPIYTNGALRPAPTFLVTDQRSGDLVTITIQPTAAVSGTLTAAVAGNIYQFVLTGSGEPVSLTVAGSPSLMSYGFSSSTTLASYQQQVTLP